MGLAGAGPAVVAEGAVEGAGPLQMPMRRGDLAGMLEWEGAELAGDQPPARGLKPKTEAVQKADARCARK